MTKCAVLFSLTASLIVTPALADIAPVADPQTNFSGGDAVVFTAGSTAGGDLLQYQTGGGLPVVISTSQAATITSGGITLNSPVFGTVSVLAPGGQALNVNNVLLSLNSLSDVTGGSPGTGVSFTVWADGFSTSSVFSNLSLVQGTNLFAFEAINGETLSGVSFDYAGLNGFNALTGVTFNGTIGGQQGGGGGGDTGAVPEPSTWAMLLLGFAGIGVTLRYRRRSAEPGVLSTS